MPKPYESPNMRRKRMGQSVMAEDSEMPMEKPEETEYVSGFVPKGFFGDKSIKPGDTEPVTIKAIDPDTGEVEIMCKGSGEEPESEGALEGMDKQFPPEEDEGE